MTLSDQIQNPGLREAIIADCVQLMDEQVSDKSGLGGLALKSAYGVIKEVGAGYIPGAIGRLLPEVAAALDPMWADGLSTGDAIAHLSQNQSQAAELILSVTDARMERVGGGVVRGVYNKLRKSVKGDVEAAVPGLAKILGRHTLG